ncbi:hypothetical protein Dimus_001066 [Dionaea muscipula]
MEQPLPPTKPPTNSRTGDQPRLVAADQGATHRATTEPPSPNRPLRAAAQPPTDQPPAIVAFADSDDDLYHQPEDGNDSRISSDSKKNGKTDAAATTMMASNNGGGAMTSSNGGERQICSAMIMVVVAEVSIVDDVVASGEVADGESVVWSIGERPRFGVGDRSYGIEEMFRF